LSKKKNKRKKNRKASKPDATFDKASKPDATIDEASKPDATFDELGTAEDGDWASAVDAWDDAVAVVAGEQADSAESVSSEPIDDEIDPLRVFDGASVAGLDEDAGEALGTLLSGPAMAGEKGIAPEGDKRSESGDDAGRTNSEDPFGIEAGSASLLSDEIDQLLDHALMGADDTTVFPLDGEGDDSAANQASAVAKIGLRKARVSRPVDGSLEPQMDRGEDDAARPEPPSLALFDAIVPPAGERERGDEKNVVAGDVLPETSTKEVTIGRGVLWDLESDQQPDITLESVDLPAELLAIDLETTDSRVEAGDAIDGPASWENMGAAFLAQAESSTSNSQAAELAWIAGVGYESSGDSDEATDCYETALGHLPDYLPALMALRRIHTQRGQSAEVSTVLRRLIERLPEGKQDSLKAVLAEYLWLSENEREAAQHLVDEMEASSAQSIRRQLIRLDMAPMRSEDATDALRVLANRTANSALTLAWARGEELRQNWDVALRAYQDASDLDTDLGGAWEGALRVAEKLGDREAVGRALAGSAAVLGPWGGRRERRLGNLARHTELEGFSALDPLRRAAAADAEEPFALECLIDEFVAQKAWREAAEALPKLRDLLDDEMERARINVDAADIYRWRLDDAESARNFYREALELAEDYRPAIEGMNWCQTRLDDPEERLLVFQKLASERSGKFAAATELECARILEHDLDLSEDAISSLQRATKKDPSGVAAVDRLSRLGILDVVVESLERRASASNDSQALYGVAAEWCEGPLSDSARAARAYEKATGDPIADLGRIRILQTLGQEDELLDEFGRQAERADDPDIARWWWTRRGYQQFSEAPSQAESSFRLGLLNADVNCGATLGLSLLYGRQGRLNELRELWGGRCSEESTSPRQEAVHAYRLGNLDEYRSSSADAWENYKVARGLNSDWTWLAQAEERLLLSSGDLDAITEMLRNQGESELPSAKRLALLFFLWQAQRQQSTALGDNEERFAEGLSEHIFSLSNSFYGHIQKSLESANTWIGTAGKTNAESLIGGFALEFAFQKGDFQQVTVECERLLKEDDHESSWWPLFLARGKLGTGVGLADSLIALAERDGATMASPLFKAAGRIYERENDNDSAAKAYRAALSHGVYVGHGLRFLIDHATANGETDELAQLYRRLALACESERDASIFWTRTGELSSDEDAYQTAITAFDGQLAAVIRMHDEAILAERWRTLHTAAEAGARACRRPENRQHFLRLAARVAEEKLNDPNQAIEGLRRLQQSHILEHHDFARLSRLLDAEGRFEELATVLESRLEGRVRNAERRALHLELAAVYQDKVDAPGKAKKHLRAVLASDSDDVAGWARLSLLYEADEEWAEAADAIIRQAQQESDASVLGGLFWRLGIIYQERTPDLKRAVASFNKVLILDPDHQDALARISRLFILDHDYEQALSTTAQLFELEEDPHKKIEHLLRMAKIHEEGFKDPQQAALTYKRAMELAPNSLPVIEGLADYFARQNDQRSLIVHLDGAINAMHKRLEKDAFDTIALETLFRLFGKRGLSEGQRSAAQILELLGELDGDVRKFLKTNRADETNILVDDAVVDEYVHHRSIPGGFRQVFQLLAGPLRKLYPTSLRQLELSRNDRITSGKIMAIAESVAGSLGAGQFELYQSKRDVTRLSVENTSPPTIIIGSDLLKHAGDSELRFMFGRAGWLIRSAMVLPACMDAKSLLLLVAGIIRQYADDFAPADCDLEDLKRTTKELRSSRVIPKKLKQELMPYVLECAGSDVDLAALGATITHSANRAGLLFADSLPAALSVLALNGRAAPSAKPTDGAKLLQSRGNPQVEEMMRFALSEDHFQLRRLVRK
jgi:Tfp pilus assembly protein PilF